MKNYYNILGIDENASKEEIKKAYWSLAQRYHPDKGVNKKTHRFNEINEAQQVLLDESKRLHYDMLLNEYLGDSLFIRWIKNLRKHLPSTFINTTLKTIQKEKKLKYSLITLAVVVHIVLIAFVLNNNNFFLNEADPPKVIVSKKINTTEPPVEAAIANEIPGTVSGYATDTITSKEELLKRMAQSYDTLSKEDEIVKVSFSDSNSLLHPNNLPLLKKGKVLVKKKRFHKKIDAIGTIRPGTDKLKSKAITGKRNFTDQEFQSILKRIIAHEVRSKGDNGCVQVRKAGNSNIKNAFSLAKFLKDRGYVISGRETITSTVKGFNIESLNRCLVITIGSL